MKAKYPGTCQYCHQAIEVGDEITRGNGERRHRGYGHARCVPTAGAVSRAGFVVEVLEGSEYIPTGHKRQFVRESYANAVADSLRRSGARRVEVRSV